MNIKESYFAFLDQNNAKEKLQKVISEQIEEWKQQPYYEYNPTVNDFGDHSGEVNRIPGKTIGDVFTTESQILTAYSGNSEATYVSHCGLAYKSVAEEIAYDITDTFCALRQDWIRQNRDELLAELKITDYDETWEDDDLFMAVNEELHDEYMEEEWFVKNFPQYCLDDEGNPNGDPDDLVFWISV